MNIIVCMSIIFCCFNYVLSQNVNETTEAETTTISTTPRYVWHRKGVTPEARHNSTVRPRMATPCLTPNNDPAYCVEIQQCPKLLHQLNNSKAFEFLRNSSCGPINQNSKFPKVCCGKYNNYKNLIEEDETNILPKKCGFQNVTIKSRIVGGREAMLGEFPWLVRLVHKNRYDYRSFGCSGFLIHAKYVLTAAHCITSDIIDQRIGPVIEVQFGEHDTRTEIDCNTRGVCAGKPFKKRVASIIVHPRYIKNSKNHHHDIALIHMKKPVKLSDYVYPICLLENTNLNIPEFWISGWGSTENATISTVKMKVEIPHFPLRECRNKYSDIDIHVTKNQICAGGEKGKDSCTGDSGGPLMVAQPNNLWYAAGIVSYGLECGRPNWPGVYTNITSYLDWIKNEMRKESRKKRTNH